MHTSDGEFCIAVYILHQKSLFPNMHTSDGKFCIDVLSKVVKLEDKNSYKNREIFAVSTILS